MIASAPSRTGAGHPIPVVAVLVLYRCTLSASGTWQRLLPQVRHLDKRYAFRLLLCENGGSQSAPSDLPPWVEYCSRPDNGGLAWAYNAGLARAKQAGAPWLLTLDQDTSLPADFLERMLAHVEAQASQDEVAAIVPCLVSAAGLVYSPKIARVGREADPPAGMTGIASGDIRAFNTAALLRVRWLEKIGGYSQLFWLSFLDHATFRSLYKAGGKVFIAGDVQVIHHLSLEDSRSSMSEAHFTNFAEAEAASMDLYGSRLESLLYTLRLAGRLRNQRRRGDPAHFARQTWIVLSRRLRWSRRRRLAFWMEGLRPQ